MTLLSVMAMAALLFIGCSNPGEPPAPANEPVADTVPPPLPDAADSGAPAADDGVKAGSPRLTLPADFPSAVPLLPRRRIHWFNARGNGSLSLTCSVPEGRRQAAAFYRQALADGGWDVTLDSLSGGMNCIAARRDDGSRLTVNIIVNHDDQRTMIGLFHRPASE
jgi:hypothetical protein